VNYQRLCSVSTNHNGVSLITFFIFKKAMWHASIWMFTWVYAHCKSVVIHNKSSCLVRRLGVGLDYSNDYFITPLWHFLDLLNLWGMAFNGGTEISRYLKKILHLCLEVEWKGLKQYEGFCIFLNNFWVNYTL